MSLATAPPMMRAPTDDPNAARLAALGYLSGCPGASTRMVARALGLDETTADYHLRRLAKQERLQSEMRGRERAWWPIGGRHCPVLRRAIPALRREETRAAALALTRAPATANELADRARISLATARWSARVLADAGLAQRTRNGRIHLAEGATPCIALAAEGKGCDQWGKCALSRRDEGGAGAWNT